MSKKNHKVILIILLFLLIACGSEKYQAEITLPKLNIAEAFTQNRFIGLSEFVEKEIEYVPLETSENCLIGASKRVYVSNTYILVFSFRQILLFDRTDGSFIRKIGEFDKGPGGYMATIFSFPFDSNSEKIYARGWERGFVIYNLEGDFLGNTIPPEGGASMGVLDDSIYVAYIRNISGNQEKRLVVYRKEEIINIYPNDIIAEAPTIFTGAYNGWFYKFGDELRFLEWYTDTIFQVTKYELHPKYVLQMEEFAPPYEKQNTFNFIRNESENYFRHLKIFESEGYLFYELVYEQRFFQGVYDKKKMETYINKCSNGFENDVDNFMPLKFTSISNQGELIGVIEAWVVEQWFKDNPEKVAQLPTHLKELESLTENDNPVVMIARLKG